jgi:hypothetical protein
MRLFEARSDQGALFGSGLGEDWVVPREGVRYLVARELAAGALLSAYDAAGRIVGERFAASLAALEAVLEGFAARGLGPSPRAIPGDAPSALRWLDSAG